MQEEPERPGKLEEPERALHRQQRLQQAHEVDPQAGAARYVQRCVDNKVSSLAFPTFFLMLATLVGAPM